MKAFAALYVALGREFARDRAALLLNVALPVLFIALFGLLFSGDAAAPSAAAGLKPLDYIVPGILAMSFMNLGLYGTAPPLIALRAQGVLRRLGATPLPRATLLAAYVALRLTLAAAQAALTVAVAVVCFDVAMAGSWLALAGWALLGALTCVALGFCVAAVARSEESVNALVNLVSVPMLFLSGVFFPVDALHVFLRPLVRALPLTHIADALRQTMLGAPPASAPVVNLAVQVIWLAATIALAVRFFKWDTR